MVQGRVITSNNIPMKNVAISTAVSADSVIQETDATGNFKICLLAMAELQFTASGYVPKTMMTTTSPMTVTLERIGKIFKY